MIVAPLTVLRVIFEAAQYREVLSAGQVTPGSASFFLSMQVI
jgi:hypothetical protein